MITARQYLLLVAAVVQLLLLSCSFCEATQIASTKQVSSFSSGNWQGGVYADEASGKFVYCAAWTVHSNNRLMAVAFGRNNTWGLIFAGDFWHFTRNEEIPVQVWIGWGSALRGTAIALATDMIYVPMAAETALVEQFRHAHLLRLYDGRDTQGFDLTGTSKLMVDLGGCVDAALTAETGGGKPSPSASREARKTDAAEQKLSTGSGVFISDTGQVLTNDHVIDGCREIWVRRNGDATKAASIIARDTANDLALLVSDLHVDATDVASFRADSPLRAGESIAVYGFPLAGALSSTGNVVSGNITALTGLGDDVRYFQISAPAPAGQQRRPPLGLFRLGGGDHKREAERPRLGKEDGVAAPKRQFRHQGKRRHQFPGRSLDRLPIRARGREIRASRRCRPCPALHRLRALRRVSAWFQSSTTPTNGSSRNACATSMP